MNTEERSSKEIKELLQIFGQGDGDIVSSPKDGPFKS
jgi:hypothetical protein